MKSAVVLFLLMNVSLFYAMDTKNGERIAHTMIRYMERYMAAVEKSSVSNKECYDMLSVIWGNELQLIMYMRQLENQNINRRNWQTDEPSAKRRRIN